MAHAICATLLFGAVTARQLVDHAVSLMGGPALIGVERVRFDETVQWQRFGFRNVAARSLGSGDHAVRAALLALSSTGPAAPLGVRVEVDSRIELMTIVQELAGYPVLTPYASSYRTDALAYFGAMSAHPAVALFDTLFAQGFAFDAVPKAFMWMSPLPELRLSDRVPEDVAGRAGGRGRLARFAALVRDFAAASDFDAFYRAHEGMYDAMIDSTSPVVEAAVEQLGDYLGAKFTDARVVLGPLLHDGGFAMRGGEPAVQAFVGPAGISHGLPDFGGADRLGPLIWHEFAHTVVNPLTVRDRADVDMLEVHDTAFRATMRRQAYTDWETIVDESVIRAIEVRLTTRVLGAEAGTRKQAREVERGFVHVPALAALLQTYERNRATYPTLASYYPYLLEAFWP